MNNLICMLTILHVGMAYAQTASTPQILADHLNGPVALALDSKNVYVSNSGSIYQIPSVIAVPKNGGTPQTLVGNTPGITATIIDPFAIAVIGNTVYWDSWQGSAPIYASSPDGTNQTALVQDAGLTENMVVDGSKLYWADNNDSQIKSADTITGQTTIFDLGNSHPLSLTRTNHTSIWCDFTRSDDGQRITGSTVRVMKDGDATPSTIFSTNGDINKVATDGTNVFFTLQNLNVVTNDLNTYTSIMKMPLAGGKLTGLVGNQLGVQALVTDGKAVYWTASNCAGTGGSIQKVSINGGAATTLATGLNCTADMTIDHNYLYWVNRGIDLQTPDTISPDGTTITKNGGDGSLMRIELP